MNCVQYMNHMGDDDTVCDAARVSMDKQADLFTVSQNERLINYLAKNKHWSPFAHCTLQLRFRAPIFIARQLAKHQIGFAWNEVSRRYVNSPPTFWLPYQNEFRLKADNVKQGSSCFISERSYEFVKRLESVQQAAELLYKDMIEANICAEQARAVLPQSMMTEWIWTGSLYAWSRMYKLRIDPHAQEEVRWYAAEVEQHCHKYFPLSWQALKEND